MIYTLYFKYGNQQFAIILICNNLIHYYIYALQKHYIHVLKFSLNRDIHIYIITILD